MDTQPTPVQCTLTPRDAAGQLVEWAEVRKHLVRNEAIENGTRMTFPAHLEQTLRDLAIREASCCRFLDLSIENTGEHVVLEVSSRDVNARSTIALIVGAPVA